MKLHLSRKGRSAFAKNVLNFIVWNWYLSPLRDICNENENVSNALIVTVLYVKKTFNNIHISDINKLIFEHLNSYLLRNKFNPLCQQTRGSVDIFMISKTKLDDSFPQCQCLIEGFHMSFIFRRNKIWGSILLHLQENIPFKVLSHDFSL